MADASKLTNQEKIFLAGSIKNMILADGIVENQELESLDLIEKKIKFDDFEECLEEFEREVKDSDSYWKMAEKISNEETKELVLEVLHELSIQDGFMKKTESNLLEELRSIWKNIE